MPDRVIVEVDEGLSDLIPGFLAHKRADISAILEAVARRDYQEISHVAHRIKGERGSYGLRYDDRTGALARSGGGDAGRWRSVRARAPAAELHRSRRDSIPAVERLAERRGRGCARCDRDASDRN